MSNVEQVFITRCSHPVDELSGVRSETRESPTMPHFDRIASRIRYEQSGMRTDSHERRVTMARSGRGCSRKQSRDRGPTRTTTDARREGFGMTTDRVLTKTLKKSSPMGAAVNGAFRGQRITGQQRYATELAARLEWTEVTPPPRVQRFAALSHLWSQALALLNRETTLVSFTSRAPAMRSNHALAIHDLFVLEYPEWYSLLYRVTHAPLLWLQLRRARLLFAVSDPVAAQLTKYTKPGQRIVVVPNAPAEIFLKDRDASRVSEALARHSLSTGKYVLAVGGVDPRKNLGRLSSAFNTLDTEDVELVYVGGGSPVFSDAGDHASARDLGYVSDEDLAALYAGAAFVAFVSLDEGFGLPAIEALASGARLLTSDVPVLRWVCASNAKFVDPHSTADIANGIRELLSEVDSDEDASLRKSYARMRFSWDRSAEILKDAVNDA